MQVVLFVNMSQRFKILQMTFTRPANHRKISFQEIAAKTGIPLGEVEILAMKAMSLGLVKGTIDQVTEKVHMTWVQPRVLDKQQVMRILPTSVYSLRCFRAGLESC